jgi:EAL domain-containing protein (putative c-di-GMP-specific phosphodiesterase class I)
VNLSADHFARPGLVAAMAGRLAHGGLMADWLRLEITESTLLHEDPSVVDNIRGLRALGMRISLDDFGTGYSSLSYLERIPVDELKIDRSFVRNLRDTTDPALLIRAIIGMGKELGMTVVAEGVESDAQSSILSDLGCDIGQGYHYARPMPVAEFEAWTLAEQVVSAMKRSARLSAH